MGMDVFGDAPVAKEGEYFRNNVWWWRPLWDYCRLAAPELTAKVSGHSNDGDGLGTADSLKLAAILQKQINSGETRRYQEARQNELNALPDEPCVYCNSTGIRTDHVSESLGMQNRIIASPANHPRLGQKGWCNGCDGKGYTRPFETSYSFSVENVQEFVNFLNACGGFKIC